MKLSVRFLLSMLLITHFAHYSNAQLFGGSRDSITITYFIELKSVNNPLDFVMQFDRRPYSPLMNDTTLFRQFQQLSERDSTQNVLARTKQEIHGFYRDRKDTLIKGNWQLESIELFAFDNPCCSPASSFHEGYAFSANNNALSSIQLAEVFGKNWRFTTLGDGLLVVGTGYFYIMNDSGEGSISCVFRLKDEPTELK